MRISTSIQFDRGLRSMQDQQVAIAKLQAQISSNRKVLTPSDDPVAASREVGLSAAINQTAQMLRNQSDANSQLTLAETYISQSIDQVQLFRARLVQAGSGILSASDRESIAIELQGYRDQVLSIANQQDTNGLYLFSGFKANTLPFATDNAGNVVYRGDNGIREIQVGPTQTLETNFTGAFLFTGTMTGDGFVNATAGANNTGGVVLNYALNDKDAWAMTGATGAPFTVTFGPNGDYTVTDQTNTAIDTGTLTEKGGSITIAGVDMIFDKLPADGDTFALDSSTKTDIFEVLDNAIAALRLPQDEFESARRANLLNEFSRNLDNSLDRLIDVRGVAGSRRLELDSLTERDQTNKDNYIADVTRLTGLTPEDMIASVSELSLRTTTLEAAQKTYTVVSRLSLFDYL